MIGSRELSQDAMDNNETTVSPAPAPTEAKTAFFQPRDWLAGLIATVLALAVYVYTLAPTVTLEDSGEMAVAADYLGVPHPPGYPLWTFLSWVFTRIFRFVHYLGQPNPAWAVALLSAVFGALTAGTAALLVSRVGALSLERAGNGDVDPDPRIRKPLTVIAGIVAGLAIAFAPVVWSQSVIVEVYTMNALLVVIQLIVATMWMERGGNRLLFTLAALFSVALTHYFYASAVNGMIIAIAIWSKDRRLFWNSTAAVLLLLGVAVFFKKAFPEAGVMIKTDLTGMLRWLAGKVDHIPRNAAPQFRAKYLYMLGGGICAAAILPAWFVIGKGSPGVSRAESLVIRSGIGMIFFALSWFLFSRAYRAGIAVTPAASAAVEEILGQKIIAMLGGTVLVLLPICLWVLRESFFRDLYPKSVSVGIVALFLLCLLVAGRQFTEAFALNNPMPVKVFFDQDRAGAYFMGSLLVSAGLLICLLRRELFPEWPRMLGMGVLIGVLWVAIHLYLPWASEHNPPMNWGYPRTWQGFNHAVFRGQYAKIEPSDPSSIEFGRQALLYAKLLFRQFTLPVALLGLVPFTLWHIRFGRRRISGAAIALILAAIAIPFYTAATMKWNFHDVQIEWASWIYRPAIVAIVLLSLIGLFALFFGWVISRARQHLGDLDQTLVVRLAVIFFFTFSAAVILQSISPGELRQFAETQDAVKLSIPAVYTSEMRVAALQGIRTLVGLGLLASYALSGILLAGWLFQWAWKLSCSRSTGQGLLFSVLPAAALFALLMIRSGITAEQWYGLFNNPGTRAHLIGVWEKVDEASVFRVGPAPVLLTYVVLLLYMACAGLIGFRRGLMTDSPDADPPLSCGWAIDRSLRNWILMTLYTFIGWGLVFACFANIKHDLQDIFIQRVKFLASYAVYALWIGCGALFLVDRIIPSLDNRRGLRILGMGLACLLPLVPIANNAYNYRLVKAVGAVEQNGHDFGWQFGNYQLRGADAILEEITEHEEPPPNPCFPPEMTPDAIFFGGTDPGRFVPTYMIYSARVREDVYLITQNALADNTYMSVMRDLYGDRIWIPAQPDSAQAFKIYVDEVKAGKRPKNADLKIENGRVQVSGALGVMEINGILAEMIFNRNNYRHGFYVEESYVIRWMFPYLTPHGLIMKINPKQVHVDALKREARNDLDFWDWFTRRLLTNPTFDRDVCAQKSFSKLRSAIGGLYAARGLVHAAETAFREARTLYPLSPEANFRLVQEVFLRAGRFEEAKAMIRDFSGRDPGNTKIEGFYKQVEAAERVTRSIQDLEAKARARKLDLRGALDLCNLYLNSKMMDKFDKLTSDLMANTNLPPTFLYTLAQLLERGDRVPKMVTALDRALPGLPQNAPPEIYLKMATLYAKGQRLDRMSHVVEEYYLKKNPTDWKAWLDLASLKLNLKDKGGATRALEQALRFGGRQAAGIARRDRRFDPIIEDATKRAQKRIGLPTPSGLPGTDPRFPRSGPLR